MIGLIFGGSVFAVGVLYGLACDLCRWFENARWVRDEKRCLELIRMSELVSSVIVTDADVAEAEREARVWSEVAELELLFALPAREPRRVQP